MIDMMKMLENEIKELKANFCRRPYNQWQTPEIPFESDESGEDSSGN